MWLQRFTRYLCEHNGQALLLAFLVTFLPLGDVFVILLAILMTLQRGPLIGTLFFFVVMISSLLFHVLQLYSGSYVMGQAALYWVIMASSMGLLTNVVTWCVAVMVHKKIALSTILQTLTLLGILIISVLHLFYADEIIAWQEEAARNVIYRYSVAITHDVAYSDHLAHGDNVATTTAMRTASSPATAHPTANTATGALPATTTTAKTITQAQRGTQPPSTKSTTTPATSATMPSMKTAPHSTAGAATPQHIAATIPQLRHEDTTDDVLQQMVQIITTIKHCMTGVIVAFILCKIMLYIIIARWWQSACFSDITSLRQAFHHIRLCSLAGMLFIISLVLTYLKNNVVLDIIPVAYLLFCTAGLSVVHYTVRLAVKTVTAQWFWLIFIYTLCVIISPFGLVTLCTIALIDIFGDIRKRLNTANM